MRARRRRPKRGRLDSISIYKNKIKQNKKKSRLRKRKNRIKEELLPHLANGEKKVVCKGLRTGSKHKRRERQ